MGDHEPSKNVTQGEEADARTRQQEVTTAEAAHRLNVSPRFISKAIDEGRLKGRGVGGDRRVALEDLSAFERQMRKRQAAALERLADEAHRLGLDY
jgi:excisionase family DNA binding protein